MYSLPNIIRDMKKDEFGRTCIKNGENVRRGLMGDLGIDGSIILRYILEN